MSAVAKIVEISGQLDRIYEPVKEELKAVEKRLYDLVPADMEPISTVEKYIFDNGGKRLRPALVLLSARVVRASTASGTDIGSASCLSDRAINFAVAAELIHTATLVHDDLLDGSMLRRGHRTINSGWGSDIAVLLGDHLYLKATEILTSEDVLNPDKSEDFKQVYRASNLMLQTATKIFKGEVLQHQKRGKLSTTEEDYFSIIEGKSASFISSCCMIGALLDGKSCPGADEYLAGYGLNLGIAFQIRDDILDIMGEEKKIGKAVGSDLKDGRLTLPVIHLMANSRDGNREYLESILGSRAGRKSSLLSRWWRKSSSNGFHKKHLERVRKMLLASGSVAYSMDVAFRFAEMAKRNLEAIPDSSARQSLISLADHVMTREY